MPPISPPSPRIATHGGEGGQVDGPRSRRQPAATEYDMPKLDLSSVRPDRGLRWCLRAVMDPRLMAVYGAQRPPALYIKYR